MNTRFHRIAIIISVFALTSVTLLALPLTLNAQDLGSNDLSNEEVIQAMTQAISAGDIEGALSYFAENAYFIGYWMGELEASVGHDELRAQFEALVAGDFRIESEVIDTFGEGSVLLAETHTSGAGIPLESFHLYDVYLIEDGKIQVYFYYLSEESITGIIELMASMAPPAITAEDIVGTWQWHGTDDFRFQFRSDGTYRASTNVTDLNSDTPQDIGTYVVEDGVLYITSGENTRFCMEGYLGVYELSWSEDGALQLTLQEDRCYRRRAPSSNPQPFVWESEAP